jgi:damage-control phosphatase, subfamily I
MNTSLDCVACFVRQALESARFVSDNSEFQEQILKSTLLECTTFNLQTPPPVMAQKIHRLIKELTGCDDPYKQQKIQMNAIALEFVPALRAQIVNAQDPLLTAASIAIAGNIIDMGIYSEVSRQDIQTALQMNTNQPLHGQPEQFMRILQAAHSVLYLADNAGEIVFDGLLIEQIQQYVPAQSITLAVRGKPILNDVTLDDLDSVRLHPHITIIDNGSDAPGTLLPDCSPAFQTIFNQADLIISKGQGNYETLSNTKAPIVFLFKAKCPVIAKELGVAPKTAILQIKEPLL